MFFVLTSVIYICCIIYALYSFTQIDGGRELKLLSSNLPRVSIIVPTLNEGENIGYCLQSLTSLNYPDYEIIVVDGGSKDSTRRIIAEQFSQVMLLSEPPRPKGWVGKPWACHNGYLKSTGDILLFTDADTFHHPESLIKLIPALLNETDGFLTIVTRLILNKFWEYTLIFIFQVISLAVLGGKGSGGRYLANGQYLMFTRSTYEKIGGHQSVKNAVIEDMELASLSASKGIIPVVYAVPELVSVKMYRQFNDFVEGFSKNLALGSRSVGIHSFLRISALMIWIDGWILFLALAYLFPDFFFFSIAFALFSYLLYVVVSLFGEYKISQKMTWHIFLFPLLIRIYYFVLLKSFYLVLIKKEVSWKGIRYSTD